MRGAQPGHPAQIILVTGLCHRAKLPNVGANDYVAMARACGLTRVHRFASIAELESGFDAAVPAKAKGHTFVVLEVEPFSAEEQKLEQPPFDGPEMKYRFARAIERDAGVSVIGYRL